ncbi:RNA-directed DNA polymerase, eukaryota [Tanacetum coccineum]
MFLVSLQMKTELTIKSRRLDIRGVEYLFGSSMRNEESIMGDGVTCAVHGDKIDSLSVRFKVSIDALALWIVFRRRSVRDWVESKKFSDLSSFLNSVVLSTSNDRWYFSLSSSGEFSVKDTRLAIDDLVLPSHSEPTRWVKLIPIKINVFMRARRGCLPTRYNLVQKGVILESTSCPVCFSDEEDVHHLLFRCSLSQEVLHRVCRWWEIDFQLWRSFSEWDEWFSSIRLPGSVKGFLEGVFYVAWWFIWGFRNRSTFDVNKPSRSILLTILFFLLSLVYSRV